MNTESITSLELEIDSTSPPTLPYTRMRFRLTDPLALAQKFTVSRVTHYTPHMLAIELKSGDGRVETIRSYDWDELNRVRNGHARHTIRFYFEAIHLETLLA